MSAGNGLAHLIKMVTVKCVTVFCVFKTERISFLLDCISVKYPKVCVSVILAIIDGVQTQSICFMVHNKTIMLTKLKRIDTQKVNNKVIAN